MSTLSPVWLVQPLRMALSHDVPSLSEHSLAVWPLLYFPCSDSGRRPKALILFHGEQSRPHDLHVSCALWCCGLIAPRPVSGQSKNTHTFTQIFMSASIDIKNHEITPISPVPTQQESAHSKIISLYYLVETALKLSGPRFSLWEDLQLLIQLLQWSHDHSGFLLLLESVLMSSISRNLLIYVFKFIGINLFTVASNYVWNICSFCHCDPLTLLVLSLFSLTTLPRSLWTLSF